MRYTNPHLLYFTLLYSWQADDHQVCWGAWERSSWASVRRRFSYFVVVTGHDDDLPHTHNSRCLHNPPGLHQSYTHCTQRPPTVSSCSPAVSCYIWRPTVTSNMLRNIQTDATLTSLQLSWTTHAHTDTVMRGGVCSLKRHKPLTHQWKNFGNLLVCISWAITGQPRNSVFIRRVYAR